jgi:hypothetical protein
VFWAFTKVVRLKRYERKRLVIVHERGDLSDAPRFLVTDALYWESGRVIQPWKLQKQRVFIARMGAMMKRREKKDM